MDRMLAATRQLIEDMAKAAASPEWSLSAPDLIACLRAWNHLEQAAAAVQLRLARQADANGIPREQGHPALANWLRAQLVLDSRPARDMAGRATALRDRPAVEQALLDGRMDVRQASVVADAVNELPAVLARTRAVSSLSHGQIVAAAEDVLIKRAEEFSPYYLRKIGERILFHVAPDIAEEVEKAALDRQEARAHARRGFTVSAPVDGLCRLSGNLGVEDAAIVNAALDPLCRPVPGDDRDPAQRRADALADLCRLALRTGELPENGGEPPQLAITVAYDPLARSLGTADLDTGDRVSPVTARRLACDARILPAVLGTAGQVLNVGRTRRPATRPIRRALTIRDRGCAFPGCDRPPRWCDAHHIRSWLDGGRTRLHNLVLLCRYHHRVIHDPKAGWQIRLGADRHPDFIPPTWEDPEQKPRRNRFHPRT
jgi:hypothetical protein